MLLAILCLAGLLRFWQLGSAPPGLYHDEAYNGLDALAVMAGETRLFFPDNNGREPAYIYLTAIAISFLGRTALAVRFVAAVAGTATTLIIFGLGRHWFNVRIGLFSALLWAVTLWPVHLSRVGLRAILLAPLLGLTFWLASKAFQEHKKWLWLLAGICYGLSLYTYLAARFVPLLFLMIGAALWWQGRGRALWPGVVILATGAIITALPLIVVILMDPELAGRTGQVSILNETINQGDFWGTLWRHSGHGLGLFLWRGDTIWRHNPAGRPVFDHFMALPWLLGIGILLRNYRQPASFSILLWHVVMLGPTIFAEDAPHFLRASGILPIVVLPPAIGLSQIWSWSKLPVWKNRSINWALEAVPLGAILVILLVSVSLLTTIRDYKAYSEAPETAYLFEAAAREMAAAIDADSQRGPVFVESRYRQGWASIPFLVTAANVIYFESSLPLEQAEDTTAIYVWPFQSLEFLADSWQQQQVETTLGPKTRGDLETETYPLYVVYRLSEPVANYERTASFAEHIELLSSDIRLISDQEVEITLWWSTSQPCIETIAWTTFVHIAEPGQPLAGQSDRLPAFGYFPFSWWKSGLVIVDRHRIQLDEPLELKRHEIRIGFFNPQTLVRATVQDESGQPVGDSWRLRNR